MEPTTAVTPSTRLSEGMVPEKIHMTMVVTTIDEGLAYAYSCARAVRGAGRVRARCEAVLWSRRGRAVEWRGGGARYCPRT